MCKSFLVRFSNLEARNSLKYMFDEYCTFSNKKTIIFINDDYLNLLPYVYQSLGGMNHILVKVQLCRGRPMKNFHLMFVIVWNGKRNPMRLINQLTIL